MPARPQITAGRWPEMKQLSRIKAFKNERKASKIGYNEHVKPSMLGASLRLSFALSLPLRPARTSPC